MKNGIITTAIIACFLYSCTPQKLGPISTREETYLIDVSHHQGHIEWLTVCQDTNLKFVYIKATEGATYTDPKYDYNIKEARKAGLKVGAYHYFRTTSSVKEQFQNFKKAYPKETADLIPMIDVENCGSWERKKVQKEVRKLCSLMERYYGVKPMIYSVQNTYNKYLAPEFNTYPLYIGRYSKDAPVILGKGHYTIWQYPEPGVIEGIKKETDICRFHPSVDPNSLFI